MTTPSSPRHLLPFLSSGQAQKELTHNEALMLIDAGLHPAAETIGLNIPPASPAPGTCWIVGAAPVGVWSGHADALACWTESGWRFVAAREGLSVWVIDQQKWAVRAGSVWLLGDLRGSRLIIDGEQVIGARLATVAVPTGGATVDAEARNAVAALIDRLAAHGLITP